jgi:monoamine oxidase
MNRRTFLQLVAHVGGASAVYGAMSALDLLAAPPTTSSSRREPFALGGDGHGRKILILGAGVAGLCAAYELGKAGYDCRILEARARPGGRCQTVRGGDVEVETDGRSQTCNFDGDQYFNPGPTRIAQHHCTLDYCRELGVSIEPFGNVNEAAYLYCDRATGPLAKQRVRLREARADTYGYVSELLAKAVRKSDLDERLTADDKQKLLHYLMVEGGLDESDLAYHGTGRRGFLTWPGAALEAGKRGDPFPLAAIIESGFGMMFSFNYQIDQQSTMFQIVGGMDRLPRAFAQHIGADAIEYGAVVKEIRQTPGNVRIYYTDRLGRAQQADGEFCICTIPLSVLKDIPADFAPEFSRAIASVDYEPATKIGLQFKRRFWEEDDRIFSGISRTDQTITQIMYPSCGYLGKKGIVVGCYAFGSDAVTMGNLAPTARIERALEEGSKIHPQYRDEYDNAGFSVAWHKQPFTRGAFAAYGPVARKQHYPILNRPDGRVYLAGEHMSYLTGWIGGALDSARAVATAVHERATART